MNSPFLSSLGRRILRWTAALWETALHSTATGDWPGGLFFSHLPPVEPVKPDRATLLAEVEASGCL